MQSNALTALSYAFVAMPYVVALSLGLVLPMLGVLCYSGFGASVAVVVGMFGVECLYMIVGGFTLGLSLYYTDFALLFAFVIALSRLLLARDRPPLHRAWLIYCAVFAVSLVTGLATYGSGAGVQARPYFYFVAAGLCGMSFSVDEKRVRLVLNALVGVAVLLMFITAYRWVVYYTPVKELLPPEGFYNNDGPIRVIRSHEALVLAQVLVASLFFARGSGWLVVARAISPLLLAVVVVLQHRSVWVAGLAGVLAALFVSRLQKGSAVGQSLLLVAIVVTTALPMFLTDKLSGVGQQITSSASAAVEERGSAGERLSSWKEIVNNWAAAGPRSIAVGQSFGTDPARFVRDAAGALRKLTYTAHNMYVQTLFNTGLVGLGAFLYAAGYVVRGLYRICASGQSGPSAQALLVIVLMQLVYYVPYGTDYLQSLIFGVALSYVAGYEVRARAEAALTQTKRRPVRWGWT
jgi:O-antigen ligase